MVHIRDEKSSAPRSQSPAMDPALKAKWIEALRSGEYEQAFNLVCFDGKFCCVGVGGVVAGLTPSLGKTGSRECYIALGITDEQAAALFQMNDHDRKSFPEIADFIEANL